MSVRFEAKIGPKIGGAVVPIENTFSATLDVDSKEAAIRRAKEWCHGKAKEDGSYRRILVTSEVRRQRLELAI